MPDRGSDGEMVADLNWAYLTPGSPLTEKKFFCTRITTRLHLSYPREMSDDLVSHGENGDDRVEGRYKALPQPGSG